MIKEKGKRKKENECHCDPDLSGEAIPSVIPGGCYSEKDCFGRKLPTIDMLVARPSLDTSA